MEDSYKEVYFGVYCKQCKHELKDEADEPCHDCLNEPVNTYSHKPVYFEQAERRQTSNTKLEEKEKKNDRDRV